MRTFIWMFFVMLASASYAQSTDLLLQWQKRFGNASGPSNLDLLTLVATDDAVYVGGTSSSPGGSFMYLGSYSFEGMMLWDTIIETEGTSAVVKLLYDGAGHIYAIGREAGAANNQSRVRLLKINMSNELLNAAVYLGPLLTNASVADGMFVNDQLYLCGSTSVDGFASVGWVARFNSNIDLIWDSQFDPGVDNTFRRLAVDDSNNLTVVGNADDGFSVLAVQFNAFGQLAWQYPQNLSGSLPQSFSDLAIDGSGNVYATGFREIDIVSSEALSVKLSATGELVWEQNFTNGTACVGTFIEIAPNGSIYTIGRANDFVFVRALNSGGTQLWNTPYAPDNFPSVTAALVDSQSNVFLGSRGSDLTGLVRIAADGQTLASTTYPFTVVEFANALAISGEDVFAVGSSSDSNPGSFFSLTQADLSENFFLNPEGQAGSDMRPQALAGDEDFLWFASVEQAGTTSGFTITKTDQAGNEIWRQTQTFTGTIPAFRYLRVDNLGNVIGFFESASNVTGGATYVVKYNDQGEEVFTNQINTNGLYKTGGLAIGSNGDIYLTGVNQTDQHMFVRSYSPTGAELWAEIYQSPSATFPVAVPFRMEISPQQKLVIAGSHRGISEDNELHVFQYDTDGNLEWNEDVANQPGNFNALADLIISDDGSLFVLGASSIVQTAAAAFDANGNQLWSLSAANPFSATPVNAAIDTDGNTYICFSVNGSVLVRKYSPLGALLGENEFMLDAGGTFYYPDYAAFVDGNLLVLGRHRIADVDHPMGMVISTNLELLSGFVDDDLPATFAAGYLEGPEGIFAAYLESVGSLTNPINSAVLRRYAIGTLGASGSNGSEVALSLYPNPCVDVLHIAIDLAAFEVEIADMRGRVLSRTYVPHHSGSASLDVGALGPGMYLVSIRTAGKVLTRKVVKS